MLEQPDPADELRRLFVESTTKLGLMAGALGIAPDAPVEKIQQAVRLHMERHVRLLGASNDVLISSQASMGEVWVRPAAIERLREAVASHFGA